MAKGAIEERIDYEMTKIVENIRDESTKATAPRELTVKIKLTPDDNRETIAVSASATSKLAPTTPIMTALYLGKDLDGSIASDDNGMTQTVQVKKGIALAAREQVRPIVNLRPYRTFLEVEQPESAFLIRVREGMQVGIIEADGGMWKIEARRNIAAYLEKELKELIESGNVVVSM